MRVHAHGQRMPMLRSPGACMQDFWNLQGFYQCSARRLSVPFNPSA